MIRKLSFRRRVALLLGVLVAIVVAPFVACVVVALTSPYSSVVVPATCTGATASPPAGRSAPVPGASSGTLIAQDGATSVVVIADATGATAGTAYILAADPTRVVTSVRANSQALVASIGGGIVYLFDDKIGYRLDASTGQPINGLFESDNYRGLYTSGGVRYLQVTGEITAVALGGSFVSYRSIDFAGLAYGCFFEAPAH